MKHIFNLLQEIEQAWGDTNNNETELSESFKRKIKEEGFSISDNQGGGDCMFLALSEQLHLQKGIEISQAELRQTVVQYLKKNPTLVSALGFLTQLLKSVHPWLVNIKIYLTDSLISG